MSPELKEELGIDLTDTGSQVSLVKESSLNSIKRGMEIYRYQE
jgi:hypothetical protein